MSKSFHRRKVLQHKFTTKLSFKNFNIFIFILLFSSSLFHSCFGAKIYNNIIVSNDSNEEDALLNSAHESSPDDNHHGNNHHHSSNNNKKSGQLRHEAGSGGPSSGSKDIVLSTSGSKTKIIVRKSRGSSKKSSLDSFRKQNQVNHNEKNCFCNKNQKKAVPVLVPFCPKNHNMRNNYHHHHHDHEESSSSGVNHLHHFRRMMSPETARNKQHNPVYPSNTFESESNPFLSSNSVVDRRSSSSDPKLSVNYNIQQQVNPEEEMNNDNNLLMMMMPHSHYPPSLPSFDHHPSFEDPFLSSPFLIQRQQQLLQLIHRMMIMNERRKRQEIESRNFKQLHPKNVNERQHIPSIFDEEEDDNDDDDQELFPSSNNNNNSMKSFSTNPNRNPLDIKRSLVDDLYVDVHSTKRPKTEDFITTTTLPPILTSTSVSVSSKVDKKSSFWWKSKNDNQSKSLSSSSSLIDEEIKKVLQENK